MSARPYQNKSASDIKELFLAGYKKVLLWLSTGGGKTFIFCMIVKAAAEKNKKCLIVVRGRKLVDQASQRLFRENVPHGVMMANHWNYKPTLPVQVCSIDTLIARGLKPPADLIIIDEAHLFSVGTKAVELLDSYDCFKIPVTATPYLKTGLRHLADAIVHPIGMFGLIEEGFLVDFRYFAPGSPDLSEVRIIRGKNGDEYDSEQLENVMVEGQLTGKIIEHWKQLGNNSPTICFCVSVMHSKMMAKRFNDAGIPAEHCDANTPDGHRNEVIARLESGVTKVVCNVGVFCTGVDIPPLGCIIMARPTMQKNLFIQQCGRGTRPIYADGFDLSTSQGRVEAIKNSNKPNCILLDHAGNIDRLGMFPTDEPEVDLDGKASHVKKSKTCPECFVVFRGNNCPMCDKEIPDLPSEAAEIAESDGKLIEITKDTFIKNSFNQLKREAKKKGYKPSWANYKLIERFGVDKCEHLLTPAFVERFKNPKPISPWATSYHSGVKKRS